MCISLICEETGEIDSLAVAEAAGLRACREWGGPDAPPSYHREALQWMLERAEAMRVSWRQHRGLPSDVECVMVDVPSWGASGESFARSREC